MALDQSVCTELLEAFKTSDGVDLIRDAVRYVFQELIESEATAQIGAERYERSEGRVTERNGHRMLVCPRFCGGEILELRLLSR